MSFDFQEAQREFTERIRQGETKSIPQGISQKRMQIYERNFLGTIDDILSQCFPVLKSLLAQEKWTRLVKTFYACHHSKTPYFYEIPQEFLAYCLTTKPYHEEFPFFICLAHFEWMELAIETSMETTPTIFEEKPDFSIEDAFLKASPVAELVAYDFPVHRLNQDIDFSDFKAFPTYLCFYRDFDESVKWREFNVMQSRLFQLLKENPMTGKKVVTILQNEIKNHDNKSFSQECFETLRFFLKNAIIYP